MANSGNFNTNKYSTQYNGTIGLNLSWSITSQSTADNTSTIHWVLKSNGSMSSGYYVKGGPITVTIGGVTVLNITSRINVNGSGGFSRNGNITITHDENGDKSVSMSVRAALYSATVNCTGSKTYALDHIDRYAIIDSATDFTDEGNPTIVYSNPAGSDLTTDIYVRLKWLEDGIERTTNWSSQLSDVGGTYTFDLTDSRVQLQQASWDSNTLPVTVDLKSTMNGVEYHDTKDITMTIVNANPTTSSVLRYYDMSGAVTYVTGDSSIIVQNQSELMIHAPTFNAQKYAVIESYLLNFNDTDIDITQDREYELNKPSFSGTHTATVTVTDSRGNKGVVTADITIHPWSPPTAQCTLERVNGFETNTVLTVNATCSDIPHASGRQGNYVRIFEQDRIVGSSTWRVGQNIQNNTPTTIVLDNTNEWEVQVQVRDSFTVYGHGFVDNPTIYTLTVGKGIPIAFIDTEMGSVGLHGFPDADNQLYVGGDVKVTGEIEVGDAASTRTNLGLGCTSLLSTPLTSGSTTVDASGYNMLLLIGKGGNATPSQTVLVPVSFLSSSEASFSFTHGYESQYTYIYLSISGTTVTIRFGGSNNSGSLQAVYGVN